MKTILSISLALIILLQSFSKLGLLLSFKINQNYIAKTLCINRNKPEMKCNGKCVLALRMKAAEERERQELPVKFKSQQEIFYCLDSLKITALKPAAVQLKKNIPAYHQLLCSSGSTRGVFHPPKVFIIMV